MSPAVTSVIWNSCMLKDTDRAFNYAVISVSCLLHKWDEALEYGGACDGILPATISQVTACSSSWKEPSVQEGCCCASRRTRSSDLLREHMGSEYSQGWQKLLSLWLHVKCLWVRVLMGWRDSLQTEWQARAIYRPFLHAAPGGICSARLVCFLGWCCLRNSSEVVLTGKSQCVGAIIKVAAEIHG